MEQSLHVEKQNLSLYSPSSQKASVVVAVFGKQEKKVVSKLQGMLFFFSVSLLTLFNINLLISVLI